MAAILWDLWDKVPTGPKLIKDWQKIIHITGPNFKNTEIHLDIVFWILIFPNNGVDA